jgi:hypothetical protein
MSPFFFSFFFFCLFFFLSFFVCFFFLLVTNLYMIKILYVFMVKYLHIGKQNS